MSSQTLNFAPSHLGTRKNARVFSRSASKTALVLEQIDRRLAELAKLNDGWFDGKGKAFSASRLQQLGTLFRDNYTLEIVPYLYPTPDNTIQAEWDIREWRVSLEIDMETFNGEYYSLNMRTDAEHSHEFTLEHPEQWQMLCEALKALVREK